MTVTFCFCLICLSVSLVSRIQGRIWSLQPCRSAGDSLAMPGQVGGVWGQRTFKGCIASPCPLGALCHISFRQLISHPSHYTNKNILPRAFIQKHTYPNPPPVSFFIHISLFINQPSLFDG